MAQDLELRRLNELALRAKFGSDAVFTRFLEPSIERDAGSIAAQTGVRIAFFGGYEDAERKIAAFYVDECPEDYQYPVVCLKINWNARYASPSHRDLLGAVMALGLERDATGDIAFGREDGCAYLFAHRDIADYICANLESAGRAGVKLSIWNAAPEIRPPKGEEIRITVLSERMDAVIASGLRLSRSEAQRLISAGMVKRNHIEELRGDVHLEAGDLLSIRGHGRMRVSAIEGFTRKGRMSLRLFRYTG